MMWNEFLSHFCLCNEEDSRLSDKKQKRKGSKNRLKHTRKGIHQAKVTIWRNSKQFLKQAHQLNPNLIYN